MPVDRRRARRSGRLSPTPVRSRGRRCGARGV